MIWILQKQKGSKDKSESYQYIIRYEGDEDGVEGKKVIQSNVFVPGESVKFLTL